MGEPLNIAPMPSFNTVAFEAYKTARRAREEGEGWVRHIGAHGREGDVLRLSTAHCQIKLVIAGQYTTGGTNYWDSPKDFNAAFLGVIHRRLADLVGETLDAMRSAETAKLVAAKSEIDAISAHIAQAAS